jgi:FtsH-binding integral membrane protein
MGALTSSLLSYVNQHLWCWKSLVGMTLHLVKLCFRKAAADKQPLQIVSLFFTSAAVFFIGKLALFEQEYHKK